MAAKPTFVSRVGGWALPFEVAVGLAGTLESLWGSGTRVIGFEQAGIREGMVWEEDTDLTHEEPACGQSEAC